MIDIPKDDEKLLDECEIKTSRSFWKRWTACKQS